MVLPQSMRLKGHRCFELLHRYGTRYHSTSMMLRVVKAKPSLLPQPCRTIDTQTCRFAVAISNKVTKKAVVRNRLRRLIHEHLRQRLFFDLAKADSSKVWALLTLKPSSSIKLPITLIQEFDLLLQEAGLLL